jgi:hypothetical protein
MIQCLEYNAKNLMYRIYCIYIAIAARRNLFISSSQVWLDGFQPILLPLPNQVEPGCVVGVEVGWLSLRLAFTIQSHNFGVAAERGVHY